MVTGEFDTAPYWIIQYVIRKYIICNRALCFMVSSKAPSPILEEGIIVYIIIVTEANWAATATNLTGSRQWCIIRGMENVLSDGIVISG
jgi:hypothetical protein